MPLLQNQKYEPNQKGPFEGLAKATAGVKVDLSVMFVLTQTFLS